MVYGWHVPCRQQPMAATVFYPRFHQVRQQYETDSIGLLRHVW